MCGGTPKNLTPTNKVPGLSPRVRGNRVDPVRQRPADGSIPACAGEPSRSAPPTAGCRVYPRVCGGTHALLAGGGGHGGLSPRVRGNRSPYGLAGGDGGSIPACAGEPTTVTLTVREFRVYPRVCGGTICGWDRKRLDPGLSPRVRGNQDGTPQRRQAEGSIPACAGEPSATTAEGSCARVYPRVCGGTRLSPTASGMRPGLSPRVRGNRLITAAHAARHGSIPACAGEPARMTTTLLSSRVYPRVCGGTPAEVVAEGVAGGLSPRVRGNRGGAGEGGGPHGSIPACAGEPCSAWIRQPRSRVYPRVCGGTSPRMSGRCPASGLSPRVRGNL